MTQRYFVERPISADVARLAGAEAHHLLHVMRASVGAEVVLFDGGGDECLARVERLGRSEVELAIIERRTVDRESTVRLTLAVALPKGDRQRTLVEKLVELGVHRLIPLQTERGVAQPTAGALDRLRRTVVEACKQCGRNRLMEIGAAAPWATYVAECEPTAPRLLAHTADAEAAWPLFAQLPDDVRDVHAAVGPEGGFAPAEVEAATAAGWRAVQLGPRILRIETAAIALGALAAARWA